MVSFTTDDSFRTLPQQFELKFTLPMTRAQIVFLNVSSLQFRGVGYSLQHCLLAPYGTIFAGEAESVFHVSLQPWRFLVHPTSPVPPQAKMHYNQAAFRIRRDCPRWARH